MSSRTPPPTRGAALDAVGVVPPSPTASGFSAGDAGLNGEPSGRDRAVVVAPSTTTAPSPHGLSAGGTQNSFTCPEHAAASVVGTPPALGFAPGWWLDAPSQLLVLLAVAAVVSGALAVAVVKRELRRPGVDGEVEASATVSDSPWVAGSETSPAVPTPGGPTP